MWKLQIFNSKPFRYAHVLGGAGELGHNGKLLNYSTVGYPYFGNVRNAHSCANSKLVMLRNEM
jgi:hypothetical protein